MAAAVQASAAPITLDPSLNDRVAAVRPSKTMQLTDLATSMKEQGVDVLSLAAGEPDFDTPESVIAAGIDALRSEPDIPLVQNSPQTCALLSVSTSVQQRQSGQCPSRIQLHLSQTLPTS